MLSCIRWTFSVECLYYHSVSIRPWVLASVSCSCTVCTFATKYLRISLHSLPCLSLLSSRTLLCVKWVDYLKPPLSPASPSGCIWNQSIEFDKLLTLSISLIKWWLSFNFPGIIGFCEYGILGIFLAPFSSWSPKIWGYPASCLMHCSFFFWELHWPWLLVLG